MRIKIVLDSGSDFSQVEAKKLGLTVLPLKTRFGEEEFLDGVTLSHHDFYEKLIETDIFPATSQITPYEYETAFEEALKENDYVICVTLSSKLSGCYQSAHLAAQSFEGKVSVIDSQNVAIAIRILVLKAMELIKENPDPAWVVEQVEMHKKNLRVIALLDTLEYLKKGGRISATVAFAGNLLSIKPVVTVNEGEVVLLGQARGSKAANNKLNELVSAEGGIDFTMPCALGYSGLNDSLLQKYLRDNIGLYEHDSEEPMICSIGCAIGTHVGPGTIAAAFFRKPN